MVLDWCEYFFMLQVWLFVSEIVVTRMWADAQRDGRPAEYR